MEKEEKKQGMTTNEKLRRVVMGIKEITEIMSGLRQKHQLRIKDRKNIVNFYKELGLSSLVDSAFETDRISEYQYYRLKIEDKRNDWLKTIAQGVVKEK